MTQGLTQCVFLHLRTARKKNEAKENSHYRNDHELCELCVKADQMLW